MDNIISEQSVINTIHKTIYSFFDIVENDSGEPMNEKDKLLLKVNKAICNEIKKLPSVESEMQWIPASKKLPDKDGDYLVTFKLLFTRPVEVCTFLDGHWDKGGYEDVLAWMPLPKSYEERQKND